MAVDVGNIVTELGVKQSTFKADFAKYLVNKYVRQEIERADWNALAATPFVTNGRTADGLPTRKKEEDRPENAKNLSVGIIGAGIAGLYTALICETLKIKWHIIEANPDRLGGRLYTKYLTEVPGQEPTKHDYYDIGAMRYPKTPIMERTFQLFEMTRTRLGDYQMKSKGDKAPVRYNDRTCFTEGQSLDPDDQFKVSRKNKGPVPDDAVADPNLILDGAYDRFRERIKHAYKPGAKEGDQKAAWEYLLKHDRFSLRDYLTFVEGEDFEATHWLETLNAGTGWFDQAFSEHVLESLAFDYYSKEELKENQKSTDVQASDIQSMISEANGIDARLIEGQWYYIQNGSTSLVMNTMRRIEEISRGDKEKIKAEYPAVNPKEAFPYVTERITQGKRVTKIGKSNYASPQPLSVSYVNTKGSPGEVETRNFDIVINSTTLAAMQKMDLLELDLPYDTKAAIRMLRYDTSTKVAIRFGTQWWNNNDLKIKFKFNIQGGLGKTDMPLRTCKLHWPSISIRSRLMRPRANMHTGVYPSYNIGEEDKGKPAVLLCSYTWGADSERIAAMIKGMKESSNNREDELARVMLDNLARLHTTNDADYKELLDYITKDFQVYHAYDWSNDPYTCGGAFGLFSAHQFSRLYPALVKPLADSRLHIVGEAASAHHAWVVGALDSAVRGLYNAFTRLQLYEKRDELEEKFGAVGEIDKATDYLQIALGMLNAAAQAA